MGIVVIGRACKEFNVKGAFAVLQTHGSFYILANCNANTLVVKGSIVRNCIGIHQQTVISNDGDAGGLGLCQNIDQRTGVDGSNHQAVCSVGNHILQLRNLCLNIVFGILKVNLIPKCFQFFFHVSAVLNPALRRLGRHCHANLFTIAGRSGRRFYR